MSAKGGALSPRGLRWLLLIGIFIDVTHRRKTQAALEKSESFNRAILNSVPSHIAVIDSDGLIATDKL